LDADVAEDPRRSGDELGPDSGCGGGGRGRRHLQVTLQGNGNVLAVDEDVDQGLQVGHADVGSPGSDRRAKLADELLNRLFRFVPCR
jgi:hypothetical protein